MTRVETFMARVLTAISVALSSVGCVHTYGLSAVGVTAPKRSTLLLGIGMRSDVRLPRNYAGYAGTEALVATQAASTGDEEERALAGQGDASARFSLDGGWLRLPSGDERFGWRAGGRLGVWHGSLGDARSRWSLEGGLELAPIIRIGASHTPWTSDETVSMLPVMVPALGCGPLLRVGPIEDSRVSVLCSLTLSFGLHLSSTLVP